MSDDSEVVALLDVMCVTAHNLRVTGKCAKADFLCATEALLRTYFGYDQEPLEVRGGWPNSNTAISGISA